MLQKLCFIGTPDAQEQNILASLQQQHYRVDILTNPDDIYQYIALVFPDIVVFSSTQVGTRILKLFRQLRHIKRVRVIVCHDQELQAFADKGHRYRSRADKTSEGMQELLNWSAKILMPEKPHQRTTTVVLPPRMRPSRPKPPTNYPPRPQQETQSVGIWNTILMKFKGSLAR